jgi:dolichyl-phosphate-mannose-protein mannosyltransferase
MLSFSIHFSILTNSGPGDAQMSSLFQAGLNGNDFSENPLGSLKLIYFYFYFFFKKNLINLNVYLEVAYGSRVTIKNMGYGGGLLHSHVQTYPEGSGQQQVTCYHHKDSNNEWNFLKPREAQTNDNDTEVEFVLHGDTIRLLHANTERNLHSHQVPAPVTKAQWEVSGYGNDTVGDVNDYWVIEVVDDLYTQTNRIRSLTTRMRFRHSLLGCYLRAANEILPQWGFKQVEVTCDKNNNPGDSYTHWNIERHWNDKCMCQIHLKSLRLILIFINFFQKKNQSFSAKWR